MKVEAEGNLVGGGAEAVRRAKDRHVCWVMMIAVTTSCLLVLYGFSSLFGILCRNALAAM